MSAVALVKTLTVREWAAEINAARGKTIESYFEMGRVLTEAKAALQHGEWEALFENGKVGISVRTAQRLMEVWAARRRLMPKTTHASLLPTSWYTLYELQALPDDTLTWALTEGKVTPELQRKDVKALRAAFDEAHDITPAVPDDDESDEPAKPLAHQVDAARDKLLRALERQWDAWPKDAPGSFPTAVSMFVNSVTDATGVRVVLEEL